VVRKIKLIFLIKRRVYGSGFRKIVVAMAKELQFLIYNTPEENVAINAVVKDDTIWLTQRAIAELFDCSSDNVSLHLRNIYSVGELSELAT
jgi:hypothetical protein